MRKLLLLTAIGLLGLAAPATAVAGPILNLDIHHNQTNFPPNGKGQLWFDIYNAGDTTTAGAITLEVELPSGLTRSEVWVNFASVIQPPGGDLSWSCPGSVGDSTITCTTTDSIPRHRMNRDLIASVAVHPAIDGLDRTVTATVSGGGSPDAPAEVGCEAGVAACAEEQVHISADPAGFGILAQSFRPDFFDANGLTTERTAGAPPENLVVPFDFNTIDNPNPGDVEKKIADEPVRNIVVDTPPGFLGNPTAVGECSMAQFTVNSCPPSSYVGRWDGRLHRPEDSAGFIPVSTPVYNMIPPLGAVNDLAFVIGGNPVHIRAGLDPANGYAITTTTRDINETLPPFDSKVTIWGVPAAPTHDDQRCPGFSGGVGAGGDTSNSCSSDGPLEPFLTMPVRCDSANTFRIRNYDSWEDVGDYGPEIDYTISDPMTGCEDVPFDPSITLAPTTDVADSPSGLDVRIELPQHNSCEPGPPVECEIATSPLRDATVTLPEGLTVNAAGANGLEACSEAEIGLGTDDPVRCPNGSKVADVEVTTPVLPDPVGGVVYLATPHENPFDTLLAGYIVLSEPERGLLVKIPGRIEVDEATGQLSGIFTDNPQLPFSRFDLHFKGGAHATLTTPPTCGSYETKAELTPWSGNAAVNPSRGFTIGGACAGSEADMPHSPGFDAGSLEPIAGQHSPFVVNLRREDGTQRFKDVTLKPPPGLTAKLAGTESCSDGALAAAASRSGKDEQSSPSCPAASRLGTVHAAAGAGPSPYWAKGSAYLAGPYTGAPLSMAIITPAVAGPFDLGTIVVRAALHIDPTTAEITAVSDPLPETLEGIPLNVRAALIRIDRPNFTLNGTSCNPFAVTGTLISTLGQSAGLNNRFQLGECRRLGFKPRVALQLFGGVRRGKYQGVKAVVRPRPGDANITSTVVRFPRSAFVAQENIRTVCTRVQWAADACPKGSIYGKAVAYTPLLDYPLEGAVYLRSSDNPLPDAVADFRGPAHQPIRFELAIANDSVKGALRNRVMVAPDVPVSYFRLQLFGGKKGLIVNSRNICRGANRATVAMRAHNGRGELLRPALFNRKCKVLRKRAKRRAAKRKAAKRRQAAAKRRGGRSR